MAGLETVTMSYHLGVDAGGTSTRAVVLSSAGLCSGVGRSGSGNPIASGPVVAAASLREAVTAALSAAAVPGEAITSTAIAMAGGSGVAQGGEVAATIREALLGAGVTAPLRVEADLLALFLSGTAHPHGYALVCGTGAAAVRVHDREVVATGDGLGWLLGDDGSGFWIGREVVRAAAADLDGTAPATPLTELVLTRLEVADTARFSRGSAGGAERDQRLQALVTRVYALRPVALARLAPLAFEAAALDDPVTADIITRAGRALAHTLEAVRAPGAPGPVVVGGGVITAQPALRAALRGSWSEAESAAPFVVVNDGLVGAGVLALRAAGVACDDDRFAAITSSLARLFAG